MSEVIFNNLKQFVMEYSVLDENEIKRETTIKNDLVLNGDDAIEFLLAYGKKFEVDVSHFWAPDYFDNEGDVILHSISRIITGKNKPFRKVLTVGHLEKGILAGRLDEEVINS